MSEQPIATHDVRPTFGARLTAAMDSKGVKVVEFANAMFVGERTIYRWRRDDVWPQLDAMPFVCRELGVTSDWLLGISDVGGPDGASANLETGLLNQRDQSAPDDPNTGGN